MKKEAAKVFRKPKRMKMPKRAEAALDEVLIGWKGIKDDKEKWYRHWCLFCDIYDSQCRRCPVRIKTGVKACYNTPYYEYAAQCDKVSEPKRKRLAQAEIDFLQGCYY